MGSSGNPGDVGSRPTGNVGGANDFGSTGNAGNLGSNTGAGVGGTNDLGSKGNAGGDSSQGTGQGGVAGTNDMGSAGNDGRFPFWQMHLCALPCRVLVWSCMNAAATLLFHLQVFCNEHNTGYKVLC